VPEAVADPAAVYPSGLEPNSTTNLPLDDGTIAAMPTVRLTFDRGGQDAIVDTFGGKGVVIHAGRPMFAEIALARMCVDAGWQAYWLSTYGSAKLRPKLFNGWEPALRRRDQPHEFLTEGTPVHALIDPIAQAQGSYAGCPDVLAWTDDTVLFIESKRRGRDAIRPTQTAWLAAALAHGVALDRFLLADWTFTDAPQPAASRAGVSRGISESGKAESADPADPAVAESARTTSAASSPPAGDPVEQIRRFAELRDEGLLTEDEFAAKKAQILGLG
jgi:hypothetical protein